MTAPAAAAGSSSQFTANLTALTGTSSNIAALAGQSSSTVADLGKLVLDVLSFAQIGSTVGTANTSLQSSLTQALGKVSTILQDVGKMVGTSAQGYAAADQAVAQSLGSGATTTTSSSPATAAKAGTGFTSPDGFDYNRIKGVTGNPNVTPEFLRKVEQIANKIHTKPEYLLAAMSFESGLDPAKHNPHSSATGLIQFMNSTAKSYGTTTADLAQMSSVQQLDYVDKYFTPFTGKVDTLDGVYTAILSGHAHSNPSDVLFNSGTAAYTRNAPLDLDHNGQITAGEATSFVQAKIKPE